jgi:hypothetical protein
MAALDSLVQFLTARLLDVIPEYTDVEPYRDKNLNGWRVSGAYSTDTTTKNGFRLQVNQREFAAVIFSECQHLLNHATEQRAHLQNALSTGSEPSPSWMLVTLYYFSLFVALAWTRSANKAIIYLDKEAIVTFCQGRSPRPGGGPFTVTASLDASTGITYAEFAKSTSSHFHDALWISVCNICKEISTDIVNKTKDRRPTEEELLSLRLLQLFDRVKFKYPLTWQSDFRSAINYRPGFSYRSVVKNNFLKTASRIGSKQLNDIEAVIALGERAKIATSQFRHPTDAPNECVDLLVAQGLLLEMCVELSLDQVSVERGVSCSARVQRNQFVRRYSKLTTSMAPLK